MQNKKVFKANRKQQPTKNKDDASLKKKGMAMCAKYEKGNYQWRGPTCVDYGSENVNGDDNEELIFTQIILSFFYGIRK